MLLDGTLIERDVMREETGLRPSHGKTRVIVGLKGRCDHRQLQLLVVESIEDRTDEPAIELFHQPSRFGGAALSMQMSRLSQDQK